MSDTWTIRRIAQWMASDFEGRGIESARLDADLLLAHALRCSRVQLYMDLDRPLTTGERNRIRDLVGRRRLREPVAYILGVREFFGREFRVSPSVLVPRPDTETLVEAGLDVLRADASGPVIDLCTGSGIVGVTLALERPRLRVALCDISSDALSVAEANAERHGVSDRVECFLGDLFGPLPPRFNSVPLVIANPPYVPESDRDALAPDIRDHEPPLALFAGPDGMQILKRLLEDAPRWLATGGHLLCEVGAGQAPDVGSLLTARGFVDVTTRRDLGGIDRVMGAVWPSDDA